MTKEKLEKNSVFDDEARQCKRTVVTSTGSRLEVKAECDRQGFKMNVAVLAEALDGENVKGSMHMTASGDTNMNMESTFTAKYIAASCGDLE